jgi:transcriptional regulator with XRE-family HTH domain
MSLKEWEKKILEAPGAAERVAEIEDELRLATGLTALREQAGLSQRELAERLGVKQPRVAAIEKARNVTIDVLERYVDALGATLQVTVVQGNRRIPLLGVPARGRRPTPREGGSVPDTTAPVPKTSKAVRKARKSA